MAEAGRTGGWRPARIVAVAAGVFLIWRGLFGRGRGCAVPLIAGTLIVRRALGTQRASGRWSAAVRGRPRSRGVDVVEAKSPAELSTSPNRLDRPRDPAREDEDAKTSEQR